MNDPMTAAEQAAFTAYGDMHDSTEVARLKDALGAYRAVLAAAGLLRDEAAFTPQAAVLAAKFLARESGFARYDGDGWEMLLASTVDVEVAYNKAAALARPEEDAHRRDLAYSRRVLLTIAGQEAAQPPLETAHTTVAGARQTTTGPTETAGEQA